MARLPRLVVAGQTHAVVQRGHSGQPVFADALDRANYIAALREAALAEQVQVHAYALLDAEVLLLVTPALAAGLGRMVQALGRRYVSAHNRRHGRSGTLWDGRFRCALVEPGAMRLAALRWVDGQSTEPGVTSAAQRLGAFRDGLVIDPPELWQLGNTPFDREAAYGRLLAQGLPPGTAEQLRSAAMGGWVAGSAAFASSVAGATARPTQPRPRGRPPLKAGRPP